MPDFPILLLLALLLSALIYGALLILAPARRSPYQSAERFESLHQRFRYSGFRQFAVMAVLTLLGSLVAYGIYYLCASLWYSGSLSRSLFLIRPDLIPRVLAGLTGGAAIGLALAPCVFRRLLGSDFAAYTDYQNRLTGLDNEKAGKILAVLLLIGYVGLCSLYLGWYTGFGPAGIRHAPLFSGEVHEHLYSDIVRIEEADFFVRPDGKVVPFEHFILHFADRTRWNSRNSGYDNPARNREVLELVRAKTLLR
jgi:hypothetical protein